MKRRIFNELVTWKNAAGRVPLILKGARQTGKTFLLKEFASKEFSNTIYLNFEERPTLSKIFEKDLVAEKILDKIRFFTEKSFDPKQDLLILDEIQACPSALTSLKYFKENMPEVAICAAGSLLGLHLTPQSFPVGCVQLLQIHPFSYEEFLWATESELISKTFSDISPQMETEGPLSEVVHERFWEIFKKYLIVGGAPSVINSYLQTRALGLGDFEAFKTVRKIQQDLMFTYLNDIAKHAGKINSLHIERTLRSVAIQLGQNLDGTSKKFTFKGIIPGKVGFRELAGPMDWLRKASLVIPTMICEKANLPLAAYTKDNRFKMFFFDVGLLGALLELSPSSIHDYNFGTYKGFLVENFVAQEMIAAKSGGEQLYGWSEGTAEVEFLKDEDGKIIPIEVKSGQRISSKSLEVFTQKYKPSKRYTLSGRNIGSFTKSGANSGINTTHINLPLYLISKIFC